MLEHDRIHSRVLLSLVLPPVDSAVKVFGGWQVGRGLYVLVLPLSHPSNIECGYTCHAKCQMKAPQNCTGVNIKLEAKKSKKKKKTKDGEDEEDDTFGDVSLKRASTGSSMTPSINSPTISNTIPQRTSTISTARPNHSVKHLSGAPPPEKYASTSANLGPTANGRTAPKARVLFKYDATSAEELSVKPSDIVTVVEPDDGSGWILARVGRDEGLVPASYVEIQTDAKKGPPVAPRRGAKKTESQKKYFKAMYDYDAGSEFELSIREGDVVVLVSEDKGDGWTEVDLKGKIGSVPSNYIEAVDKS